MPLHLNIQVNIRKLGNTLIIFRRRSRTLPMFGNNLGNKTYNKQQINNILIHVR